jgi:uncharacterized protein (DUF433 family)
VIDLEIDRHRTVAAASLHRGRGAAILRSQRWARKDSATARGPWYNKAIEGGIPMTLPEFLTRDDLGAIRIAGHRVGLEHLLHLYNQGYSPEMMWEEYPAISLAVVHKVIAFYLENTAAVDDYLAGTRAAIQEQKSTARPAPSRDELRRRLQQRPTAQGA